MEKINTKKLVFASLFMALALLLPLITGQIQSVGSMLLPMHIPILLCGFICGPKYGLAVGSMSPILRSVIFTMPPMYPVAVAMAFELAAYGFFSGFFNKSLPKKNYAIYVNLVLSMLIGRVVWGLAMLIMLGVDSTPFTWGMFATGAFMQALPGIAIQIVLIPPIVMIHRKTQK
ncbi:MAG TPA: ECF transporter S component [Clostridia bacterium]|nr:ECF transporter S component [Clostridia bacterium]